MGNHRHDVRSPRLNGNLLKVHVGHEDVLSVQHALLRALEHPPRRLRNLPGAQSGRLELGLLPRLCLEVLAQRLDFNLSDRLCNTDRQTIYVRCRGENLRFSHRTILANPHTRDTLHDVLAHRLDVRRGRDSTERQRVAFE